MERELKLENIPLAGVASRYKLTHLSPKYIYIVTIHPDLRGPR